MLSPYAFTVKGSVQIESANAKIEAGVANLIRVSLSMGIKLFPNR
tara:strand:+ start:220 stop:354 length:135 start_codon:yes stop_codon:yes gene_type:complete